MNHSKDNPFYHNYLFSKRDLERATIKWWEWPMLWVLPTYVQITDDGAAFFKRDWWGRIFFLKLEPLSKKELEGAKNNKGDK